MEKKINSEIWKTWRLGLLAGFATLAFTVGPGGGLNTGLFQVALTPEALMIILAGLMALVFDWFPGVAEWYGVLSRGRKQQVMICALTLIAGGVYAGSCYGWFETGLACQWASLPVLVQYILAAAGVNQAVHLLTKPAQAR